MRNLSIRILCPLLLAGWFACPNSATAQLYWDPGNTGGTGSGGTQTWNSTSGYWWNGSADVTWSENIAYFEGTAGTVTLGASETADGLTFTTTGYTMAEGSGSPVLTMGGATPTITVPSAGTETINSILGGTAGLTASGSGTLALGGANTYSGGTMIGSGTTLKLASGGNFGFGNIADNGTLWVSASTLITNNISGTGIFTNSSGATTILSGSNSFTGNVYIDTRTSASCSLVISNTYALNGTPQVTLSGLNTSSFILANNTATPTTTSINIPASVSLVILGGSGANNRMQLQGAGGTNYWNGPITFVGDGTANELSSFYANNNTTPTCPLIINGNATATVANNYAGQVDLTGNAGGLGVMNGTLTLNTNVQIVEGGSTTWTINSSGNTCAVIEINIGTLALGINNAVAVNVPFWFVNGPSILNLAGYNQQVGGLTNSSAGAGIITNSSPVLSTLTYNNAGPFGNNGPNKANLPVLSGPCSVFGGVIVGNLALTVAGGTLTLSGANSYSGTTTISNGVLALPSSGSLKSPNILIGTNGTLACSGQTLNSGQTLTGIGGAGTITGNLNLGSGSLVLNTNGVPALTVSNGTLTLGIANTVTVNVSGPLSPGTYLLVSTNTGGAVAGTPSFVTVNGVGSVTGSLIISNNELYLAFTNSTGTSYTPKNLEWRGTVNSTWDNTSTTNWFDTVGLTNAPFTTLDNVIFDDTGTGNPVNITTVVQPSSVTVSANLVNYTFSGTGSINGVTGLTVTNNGTLTIQTTNGYIGVTALNGGILSVGQLANGGSLSALGAASSGSSNLVFNGGQLQYTGPTVSIDRGATLGADGGTVAVTTPGASLTTSGSIVGTGGGGLTVSGSGAFALSGANTYNGPTTVSAGATLGLNGGTFGSSNVVNNGTLLIGSSSTIGNNISGTGILTNAPGSTLTLSGSNTFAGNVYNGTFGLAPNILVVSSSNALDGTSQVILDGGNASTLTLNAPAGAGQSLSIPSSVTLTMVTGTGTANRAALTSSVNPCTWNGPISLEGDGSGNEVVQFNVASGSPFTLNGDITATLTNNFAGQVGFVSSASGNIGIMNGHFLLNANADFLLNVATWTINSSGNACGGIWNLGGTLIVGMDNAMPVDAPWIMGNGSGNAILDLNGHNQQIAGLTNNTTGADIITNSSPALSTLTYSNGVGNFVFSPVSTFATAPGLTSGYGSFTNYSGTIAGNLALTVAGGVLNLKGVNTYSGATVITNGATLMLSGSGSIANSPNIFIGTNATFDVSGLSSYSLASGQTLTGVGATGTIAGNLDLGAGSSLVLNYTTNIPTLTVANGTLILSGSAVTVNVSGSLALQQAYLLVSATNGGQVSGTPPTSVTVNGLTNAPGTYGAYLTISGGQLYLAISQNPVILSQFPVTYTNVFTLYKGANPAFSIPGVGGVSPFAYQWFTNGVAAGGAVNTNFALTNVQASFANDYCVVTNGYGSATSFVWSASVMADPTNLNGALATYPSNVLSLNPVGYWRLNEADDGLSDGNPGVITHDYAGGNDALYTNVNLGQRGYNPVADPSDTSALFGSYPSYPSYASYGGSIQGIDVSAPNGSNGEFTVEAWVNATNQPSGINGIVAKGYIGQEEFTLNNGAPNNAFRFSVRGAGGNVYNANSTVNTPGPWYYLVGVCDEARGNVFLYINGQPAASASIPVGSGIYNSSGTPMTIGALPISATGGATNQFYGNINDVTVFNYALSSNQVAAEYQVAGPFAPVITSQSPVTYTNQFTLYAGANPAFAVVAVGTAPLSYQWFTNGVLDGSTTTDSLTLANVQTGFITNYCIVTNVAGSATSTVWTASVIAPPAPYPQAVLALNPIGYWRLNDPDDNANDGNPGAVCHDYIGGNDGIYTNVLLGQQGYNLLADPSDTSAYFGDDPNGSTDFGNEDANSIAGINFGSPAGTSKAFAVEAWVNGYSQTFDAGMVTLGYGGGGEQFDLDTGSDGGAVDHCFRFLIRDSTGNTHAVNSAVAPLFGNWYHLVGVVDEISSQDIAFYIDGRLVGTASLPSGSGILSSTYLMSIGSRSAGVGTSLEDQFEGDMNDVAVFNYALSPLQVENEYISGGGTNAPYFNPQPAATGSAAANSTLTIPVTALGAPPLGFWWTNVTTGIGIASGTTNNAVGDVTLSYPDVPLSWNGNQLQLTVTNAWGTTNVLFTLTIANGINANPTNILFGVTNSQLYLTWPSDHTGWQLQAQTNNLSVGIGTNWVNVSGSVGTNQVVVPINLTNGSVFYRLIYAP